MTVGRVVLPAPAGYHLTRNSLPWCQALLAAKLHTALAGEFMRGQNKAAGAMWQVGVTVNFVRRSSISASRDHDSPGRARQLTRSCLIVFSLLALTGVGVVAVVSVVAQSRRLPELDRLSFDAGYQRWSESAPASYRIAIDVVGPQPALYEVQVRADEVVSATINGHSMAQKRVWRTWSVPGMFDTIESDVITNERARNQEVPLPLHIAAQFDDRLGYPARYLRLDYRTKQTVTWNVTRFEILPEDVAGVTGIRAGDDESVE